MNWVPNVPQQPEDTRRKPRQVAAEVLRQHAVECSGRGEVTCLCHDPDGWMTRTEHRRHVAQALDDAGALVSPGDDVRVRELEERRSALVLACNNLQSTLRRAQTMANDLIDDLLAVQATQLTSHVKPDGQSK